MYPYVRFECFDGNPIFCSLLVVADRRHQLDRGAGPH
jgi:hypothetical protein